MILEEVLRKQRESALDAVAHATVQITELQAMAAAATKRADAMALELQERTDEVVRLKKQIEADAETIKDFQKLNLKVRRKAQP